MPPPRKVVLKYDLTNAADPFRAFPSQVPVLPEDTIHFSLHPDTLAAVEGCKLSIKLDNPTHFKPGEVKHGPENPREQALVVEVKKIPEPIFEGLRAAFKNPNQRTPITAFECILLSSSDEPLASSISGGEVVPDTGGS